MLLGRYFFCGETIMTMANNLSHKTGIEDYYTIKNNRNDYTIAEPAELMEVLKKVNG